MQVFYAGAAYISILYTFIYNFQPLMSKNSINSIKPGNRYVFFDLNHS
jgi:hypothetical protein